MKKRCTPRAAGIPPHPSRRRILPISLFYRDDHKHRQKSVGGDAVTLAQTEKDSYPKYNHPAVGIGNVLQTRILPKIEALIIKDSFKMASGTRDANRDAKKLKILCPAVVLALLKLYQHLATLLLDTPVSSQISAPSPSLSPSLRT